MKRLAILCLLALLLLAGSVQAGNCGYSYGYRSYSYYPSYSYSAYSYPSYSYSPAFWSYGRYYPSGNYYYSNNTYYREGYGAYYGEPYSTAAVQVAAPVTVVDINIPVVRVNGGTTPVNLAGEVEVPAPTASASATVTVGGTAPARSSATITSADVQKLLAAIGDVKASVEESRASHAKLSERVTNIEKFLSKPPPTPKEEKGPPMPPAKD